MALADCIAEIRAAAGRELSTAELEDLATEFANRVRERQTLAGGDDLDAIAMAAADDLSEDMVAAAKIAKRNTAINLKREIEAFDFVMTQFGDNKVLGLEALLVGVNLPTMGNRYSAAAAQKALLEGKYLNNLQADLDRAGLWELFQSTEINRDISRAMWSLNRQEPQPTGVSRDAEAIAKIIIKHQEIARLDYNRAGGFQKRLEGWIVRQSHDQYKIRGRGGDDDYARWKDYILPRLDVARTFDGVDPDKFLKTVWTGLASGVHLRVNAQPGLTGGRNIARAGSAERVLHFRSADDWYDYHLEFGNGTLQEAIVRGFTSHARTTGLMMKMGTNPEEMLSRIITRLIKATDNVAEKTALSEAQRGILANQIKVLDGTTLTPVHAMAAKWMGDARAVQRMAKLGASVFSQLGDIPFYATEMRYNGRSMLSGLADSMTNLFNRLDPSDGRQVMGAIGVYSRGRMGDIHSRFSLEEDMRPGAMSKLQQRFFKWNLMNWWTDSQRQGALRAFSWMLADNARSPWSGVGKDFKRVMNSFAIDEPEWNIIRKAQTELFEGDRLLTPEAVAAVDRVHYEELLRSQGIKITDSRIASLREEMSDKVRTYFQDRTSFAVIEPGAREAAFMTGGTQPGTREGELFRFLGELKAFPVTAVMKGMGREIHGRGSKTIREAIMSSNGERVGLAHLITWSIAYGYLAMTAKDLIKGKNPRNPLDHKVALAALVQGGGAGIYGDFLFGETRNRYGGNFASTIAGPSIGLLNTTADLWGRLLDGDDFAAVGFRAVVANTPFANLFYTRAALDYLILRDFQEYVNPGSLERLERRVLRENDQTFYARPSKTSLGLI